jgi:hypothetical protein
LTVLTGWKVGPVVVGPVAVVSNDVRQGLVPSDVEWFDKVVAVLGSGACAIVEAADRDAAIDLVAQAVDVLRVFQHVRYFCSELAQFGIAGDVGRGVVSYIKIGPDQSGRGFLYRGNSLGWTFSNPDEWTDAPVFQWAARAIGVSSPPESRVGH